SGRLRLAATVLHATARAPLDRWPAAGTGRAGEALLRAHALVDADGVTNGPAFGRTIAQATAEAERRLWRRGPLVISAAAFVDTAVVRRRLAGGGSLWLADAGGGLRLGAPWLPGRLRLDAARGLRDDAFAISVGWSIDR
ncbi:MAG TPA: hypothetical protein VNK92_05460, partial [Vicinamibacterales bacterium]|nr:hypothetical protein [Vicinamibacterales bacterium]